MIDVSIVVRTFNEERHLSELFDTLSKQTYSEFEMVVVDSGSVDSSRDIARARADKVIRIDGGDFTFGYSLNVGIERSCGRYIAILSAHAFPVSHNWLENLVRPLRTHRRAMVYGRQCGHAESKFSEASDFSRTFGPERLVLEPPRFFANNANSCIRRDLWEKHRFDEALTGLEDVEWARYWMLQEYEVIYEPTASVYHLHQETGDQIERRYYREAVAAAQMGLSSRRDAALIPVREFGWAATDLFRAGTEGRLAQEYRGIFNFRYRKARGAVRGLLDGRVFDGTEATRALLFDRTARAVEIVGKNRARLENLDLPSVKPGDVLIQVAYEGVCGTDLEILSGTLGYYREGLASYPIVPGHELSGRVVQVGPNVANVKEGDYVVPECIQGCGRCDPCLRGNAIGCARRQELGVIGLNGGYSQYVRVPGRFVHKIPPGLDLVRACLCEPLAVVLKGLRRLTAVFPDASPRDCGVVGAGTIGYLTARALEQAGHQVAVYDQDPMRRAYLEKAGLAVPASLSELVQREILVEATGDAGVLGSLLLDSPPGAAILLLGLPYARRDFSFEHIVAFDRTVVGSVGSTSGDFETALGILGVLDLDPLLEKLVPLESYDEAWALFRTRTHPKIILEVDAALASYRSG